MHYEGCNGIEMNWSIPEAMYYEICIMSILTVCKRRALPGSPFDCVSLFVLSEYSHLVVYVTHIVSEG